MKKNFMMRAASVLLVAVMLTTCAISGTFAKYITADDASDSARVAKWGVKIVAEGTLFDDAYQNTKAEWTEDEKVATITVQASSENTNVVAPGTKNDEGITFEISGVPEVDLNLEIEVEVTDIVLADGTYVDYTDGDAFTADDADKPQFTLDEDYYPVEFTLTNGAGDKVVDAGTLADVEEYFEALDTNATIHTNTDLSKLGGNTDGKYTLTWEWDFTDTLNSIENDDRADTYLGNVAAGLITDANAVTNVSFAITITATQVD